MVLKKKLGFVQDHPHFIKINIHPWENADIYLFRENEEECVVMVPEIIKKPSDIKFMGPKINSQPPKWLLEVHARMMAVVFEQNRLRWELND